MDFRLFLWPCVRSACEHVCVCVHGVRPVDYTNKSSIFFCLRHRGMRCDGLRHQTKINWSTSDTATFVTPPPFRPQPASLISVTRARLVRALVNFVIESVCWRRAMCVDSGSNEIETGPHGHTSGQHSSGASHKRCIDVRCIKSCRRAM